MLHGLKQLLAESFDNVFVRSYPLQLNPRHRPPYRLEHIRIIESMIDYAKLELGWIMEERCMELLSGFLSGTIDFWTDSHRRQQFQGVREYCPTLMTFACRLDISWEIAIRADISSILFLHSSSLHCHN